MTYTRSTDEEDWEGEIEVLGSSYPLSLRASYEQHELDEIARRAKKYLEENWQRILHQMTADLIPMHNDGWSEEGTTPLTEASFLHAIGGPDVNVWEDEMIVLYFTDGGLFQGHSIEVTIDGPDFGRKISL